MDPIFKRTSTRDFLCKPVEDEKVELLLKAAMQAPSAKNQQAWEFYLVSSKENKEKLAKSSIYAFPCLNAPICFVLAFKKNAPCSNYVTQDLALAAENILLEAEELDLGGVYLGIYPNPNRTEAVREVIKCPSDEIPFCIIPIGYSKAKKEPISRYDIKKVHHVD